MLVEIYSLNYELIFSSLIDLLLKSPIDLLLKQTNKQTNQLPVQIPKSGLNSVHINIKQRKAVISTFETRNQNMWHFCNKLIFSTVQACVA